ncbi:hypothetical protein B5X24_HaOG203935 [Helicoverpa armigera]|uniref:FLYWCH-type domain-containing protein n=1 Tax=Helicoverpa armigera TaxID=29058 RepID=A0A2W1BTM9_HELAM|nr:hypothetical protein B5X24_HaOG203935 [Helicoverpa armigera]
MLLIRGYKFTRHNFKGGKTRWHCSVHSRTGCRAAVFTVVQKILTSRGTEMLVIGGYKFGKHSVKSGKTRWNCTLKSRTRCRAACMTIADEIVRIFAEHNH